MTATTTSPTNTTHRPTGVTVLGVLAAISGALSILAGFAFIAAGSAIGALGLTSNSGAFGALGALGAVAGVLFVIFGAFELAGSYGLFTRKRWAWYAAIVIAIGQGLQGIVSLLGGNILNALIGLALAAVVVWYLMSPVVQDWFGVSYKSPWTYRQAPPHV